MKRVAALLTVFNRKETTLRCLRALGEIPPVRGCSLEIFLLDDGCTDGTGEAVRAAFPQVHLIEGGGNLFWNRGMHAVWEAAAAYAPYDFYLWLNDDVYPYPHLLGSLLSAARQTGERAIIVSPTCATDNPQLLTYGGRIKATGKIPEPEGKLTPVDYFNGNIVFIPKAVYEKVGNLDPYFHHSKGDFDYGRRAQKMGFDIFQTGQVLGSCNAHEKLAEWCDPKVPFPKRWHALHKPTGARPKEIFYLERKDAPLLIAAFHYCTTYLTCLFPQLRKRIREE